MLASMTTFSNYLLMFLAQPIPLLNIRSPFFFHLVLLRPKQFAKFLRALCQFRWFPHSLNVSNPKHVRVLYAVQKPNIGSVEVFIFKLMERSFVTFSISIGLVFHSDWLRQSFTSQLEFPLGTKT